MAKSKRQAREAALRAFYEIEVGNSEFRDVLPAILEEVDDDPLIRDYTERILKGVREHKETIDELLRERLAGYEFHRLAVVDRNVLRIAAYELYHEPSIPPGVSINEAVEIAKKYSTAESGKFVNGVLGQLFKASPKVEWDRSKAPKEDPEEIYREPEPVIEEETIEAGSEKEKQVARHGWKIRTEADEA